MSRSGAFRDLERNLLRRRIAAIDPRMRIELAAIAVLLGAFLFWQSRIKFASLVHDHGPLAVVREIAELCLGLGFLAAVLAGTRHAIQLRTGVAGPQWLALPLAPE